MRAAVSIVSLVLVTVISPQPIRASDPALSNFEYVVWELDAHDTWSMYCDVVMDEDMVAFAALSVEVDAGNASYMWSGGRAGSGASLRLKLYNERVSASTGLAPQDFTYRNTFAEEAAYDRPAVLRAAWTNWGGVQACVVEVNGDPLPALQGSPDDSHYFDMSDFNGGIGVAHDYVGAGVNQELNRSASGYLFGFAHTTNGAFRVQGPEGQDYRGDRIGIAEFTDGEWTFQLPAGVGVGWGAPWLFLMELPN